MKGGRDQLIMGRRLAEVAGDRAAASRLEYRVKRLSRAQKLALVAGRFRLADLVDDQVVEDGGT